MASEDEGLRFWDGNVRALLPRRDRVGCRDLGLRVGV